MNLQLEIPELDALSKRVAVIEDGLVRLDGELSELAAKLIEIDKGATADIKAAAALLTAIDHFHQVVNKEVAPVPSSEAIPEELIEVDK